MIIRQVVLRGFFLFLFFLVCACVLICRYVDVQVYFFIMLGFLLVDVCNCLFVFSAV